MPFRDRIEAGRALARALVRYKADKPVVLALPRGGVPVAAEVATALDAPLDLVLVRKIGVPYQPELAAGAVVDGQRPVVVRNDMIIRHTDVSEADFAAVRDRELAEIERRRKLYLGDRPHPRLEDRTVIIVDDGIATGATTRAALRAIRTRKPRKLVLAVPVAPTSSLSELKDEADDIVCLEDHENFDAIVSFYCDFTQVDDVTVTELLARHPADGRASS